MTYQFEMGLTVRKTETDELGHVNNAVYLQYAEVVARAHSDSTGLTLERYREIGGFFVVHRHEVDYLRPAHAGESLVLKTAVTGFRGPRSTRKVHIYRGDELLVKVATEWVWVQVANDRPGKIPSAVIELLPPTNDEPDSKTA